MEFRERGDVPPEDQRAVTPVSTLMPAAAIVTDITLDALG